jgi:hypothetical protein
MMTAMEQTATSATMIAYSAVVCPDRAFLYK